MFEPQVRKKVLLYLGKFPGYGFDVDGGSIMARQLIDILKVNTILDVVFIRKNRETFEDSLVHNIRYVEYIDAFNNKFIRRLKNLETNVDAIGNYSLYDIIITAHVSKFFGFENAPKEFWKKTVLFPMFCTSSYQLAGENVPLWYTQMEDYVINNVRKIITPSQTECQKLCEDYHCNPNKITVIPRGINPLFTCPKTHTLTQTCKLVYIASIKPQKNNLEAVKLLKMLSESSKLYELHLVCTIQDASIYNKIKEYITEYQLYNSIFFHIGLSQQEIAALLQQMDINISVSNWETFGRGIYEGISSGLPTFVFSRLKAVKELCGSNLGVVFCNDLDEMKKSIEKISFSQENYNQARTQLYTIADKVSYQTEQKRLIHELLK